ncbi:MAG: hypothetical protein GX033_08850 [Firmicutes bacterium]|nr:hypothetical protein [Bacillota bacterium]
MRFDFSYVHLVYALLEGKADLEELLATPAFHLIKKHGEISGMEYDAVVKAVKSVQSGNPNALAQRLLDNKDRVLELVKLL